MVCLLDQNLRPQNLLVLQGTLQGRLHLHLAELRNSEVQVLTNLLNLRSSDQELRDTYHFRGAAQDLHPCWIHPLFHPIRLDQLTISIPATRIMEIELC